MAAIRRARSAITGGFGGTVRPSRANSQGACEFARDGLTDTAETAGDQADRALRDRGHAVIRQCHAL